MPSHEAAKRCVGSLLRPSYLNDARSRSSGTITAAEFKRIEDRAVDEAVALQEAAGLDVITDGEMRRYAFYGHLVEALEGFDRLGGWSITFRDGQGQEAALRPPGGRRRLRWRRQMSVEEFTYLRGRTAAPVKVTLRERAAGGGVLRSGQIARGLSDSRRLPRGPGRLHASRDRGARTPRLRYVQIDAPQYAGLLDETIREGYRQRGSDPDRLLDACIELDNAIIDGHQGITFGIHICRGNHKSMFYASGGYDRIAEQVVRRAQVRSLPSRVRRRAIGNVRAAAIRSGRSRRRARPGELEDAADGVRGRA